MMVEPLITHGDEIDVAAQWFARRRSGTMTMQEALELELWLDADPSHVAAFQSVARSWVAAHSAATDPEILALRESAAAFVAWPRLAYRAVFAAGAVMLFATALYSIGFTPFWRDRFSPVSDQKFQTAIGQTVTVTLTDGSTVMLDSDTALRVHETWSRRDIALDHGQAFFHVAKDTARPFVVSAAGSSIVATGTEFDVRIDPDRLSVLLTEGRLHVEISQSGSAPAQQTELTAGWQLTATANGARTLLPLREDNEARMLGWRTGRLAFVGQPLLAVATELNRYSVKKIIVAQDLAAVPIDGVFHAGDIDGFVRLLVRARLVRVLNNTNAAITLATRK